MESFITSALDQLDEDARALRALLNLQRRKSITEVGEADVAQLRSMTGVKHRTNPTCAVVSRVRGVRAR